MSRLSNLLSSAAAAAPATIPSLDSLSSDWIPRSDLRHLPALSNFWGGVNVDGNVTAVTNFTLAPYVQAGSCLTLTADGTAVTTEASRWSAYQVRRKATTASGLAIRSTTRLAFEANQLLLRITVANPTPEPLTTTLSLSLDPRIRKATAGWAWDAPRPADTDFAARIPGNHGTVVLVRDRRSAAVTAFAADSGAAFTASGAAGAATWILTLDPGATRTVQVVMAVGETSTGRPLVVASEGRRVVEAARAVLRNFPTVFTAAATGWTKRWSQAFTPGNRHFSGSLPVLTPEPTDTGRAVARLYYMSVLSTLACERTNLGPEFSARLGRTGGFGGYHRVYVTGAPEYSNTVTYFWDTSYAAVLLTLLDPAVMRAQTTDWLGRDIHACYAVELVGGGTVGPWYSANDLTVFSTVATYLRYSGDLGHLRTTVGSKTVLRHLTDSAIHWQTLVPAGQHLADYGLNDNLLEVLPDYVGQVASLNAANVWLMHEAATLQEYAGNSGCASRLRSWADTLLPHVLALYRPGEGVWNCRHADGTTVPVRTVVDFAIAGNLLADHLTAPQMAEMMDFVNDELLAASWLRALSPDDRQAPVARPDHGTDGAFASWPALTAQTFARFGDYAGFLGQLVRYAGITDQGPIGQAGQLVELDAVVDGRPGGSVLTAVNAGDVMTFNLVGAGKFAEVVITDLFGFAPDNGVPLIRDASVARGFCGTLSGLVFDGATYTITSSEEGISIAEG